MSIFLDEVSGHRSLWDKKNYLDRVVKFYPRPMYENLINFNYYVNCNFGVNRVNPTVNLPKFKSNPGVTAAMNFQSQRVVLEYSHNRPESHNFFVNHRAIRRRAQSFHVQRSVYPRIVPDRFIYIIVWCNCPRAASVVLSNNRREWWSPLWASYIKSLTTFFHRVEYKLWSSLLLDKFILDHETGRGCWSRSVS